jgi:hypothetical protein
MLNNQVLQLRTSGRSLVVGLNEDETATDSLLYESISMLIVNGSKGRGDQGRSVCKQEELTKNATLTSSLHQKQKIKYQDETHTMT